MRLAETWNELRVYCAGLLRSCLVATPHSWPGLAGVLERAVQWTVRHACESALAVGASVMLGFPLNGVPKGLADGAGEIFIVFAVDHHAIEGEV